MYYFYDQQTDLQSIMKVQFHFVINTIIDDHFL